MQHVCDSPAAGARQAEAELDEPLVGPGGDEVGGHGAHAQPDQGEHHQGQRARRHRHVRGDNHNCGNFTTILQVKNVINQRKNFLLLVSMSCLLLLMIHS